MKPSRGEVSRLLKSPPASLPGILIYGGDAMRVAAARKSVLTSLLGPGAEEEMRLARIEGADLRRDPAAALDAMKAQGFFPGPRAVHVEGATDAAAPAILAALSEHAEGDAALVVTAGALTPRSALRKGFEAHRVAPAVALYDDPPSRADIEESIRAKGLSPDAEASAMLADLGTALPPGDFAQLLEALSLYADGPVGPSDVEAVAPRSLDAHLDDAIAVVADGRPSAIAPLLRSLEAQGTQPVTIAIAAMRHFRTLHAAACLGVGAVKPPLYGPRRTRVERQAGRWGREGSEAAIRLLIETDLGLRAAGRTAPASALMERALVRLAVMGQR